MIDHIIIVRPDGSRMTGETSKAYLHYFNLQDAIANDDAIVLPSERVVKFADLTVGDEQEMINAGWMPHFKGKPDE